MTDSRQCARRGVLVPSPDGAALDAAHDCPRGIACVADGCQPCGVARVMADYERIGARFHVVTLPGGLAELLQRVADSLPGARAAMLGGPGVRGGS